MIAVKFEGVDLSKDNTVPVCFIRTTYNKSRVARIYRSSHYESTSHNGSGWWFAGSQFQMSVASKVFPSSAPGQMALAIPRHHCLQQTRRTFSFNVVAVALWPKKLSFRQSSLPPRLFKWIVFLTK